MQIEEWGGNWVFGSQFYGLKMKHTEVILTILLSVNA